LPWAVTGVAIWFWGWARLTDLRFRALTGVGGGWAALGEVSEAAVAAGVRLGCSLEGASWAACCGFAAMGEGFRFRLEAGEALWARRAQRSARPGGAQEGRDEGEGEGPGEGEGRSSGPVGGQDRHAGRRRERLTTWRRMETTAARGRGGSEGLHWRV
jgi:hypothetical protein